MRFVAAMMSCMLASQCVAQTFEPHATDCIEKADLGLWSPWVDYDTTSYRGQWFRASGPLGGSCSSGGNFFAEGAQLESGVALDLRVLGAGEHFLTAKLKPLDPSLSTIRKVWHVQVTAPGDVNGDGLVSFGDFLVLARSYGATAGREQGDLDYDGSVGFDDFIILSRSFGKPNAKSVAVAQVPEPSTRMLGAAILILCTFRQARVRMF